MTSKLLSALRSKYSSPQAALRALGLDAALIEPPRLAADEDREGFRQLMIGLGNRDRAKDAESAAKDFESRFPMASHIRKGW